jgi:hypothetical protein
MGGIGDCLPVPITKELSQRLSGDISEGSQGVAGTPARLDGPARGAIGQLLRNEPLLEHDVSQTFPVGGVSCNYLANGAKTQDPGNPGIRKDSLGFFVPEVCWEMLAKVRVFEMPWAKYRQRGNGLALAIRRIVP